MELAALAEPATTLLGFVTLGLIAIKVGASK
jgi:hypothetical protein